MIRSYILIKNLNCEMHHPSNHYHLWTTPSYSLTCNDVTPCGEIQKYVWFFEWSLFHCFYYVFVYHNVHYILCRDRLKNSGNGKVRISLLNWIKRFGNPLFLTESRWNRFIVYICIRGHHLRLKIELSI